MQRHGWALEDFTKPGLTPQDSESRHWLPAVNAVYRRSTPSAEQLLFHLSFSQQASQQYGAPGKVYLTYSLPRTGSVDDVASALQTAAPLHLPPEYLDLNVDLPRWEKLLHLRGKP